MMKSLIISDLHQRIHTVQKILDKHAEKADKIIFLGDYWDSFIPEDGVEATTQWLIDTSIKFKDKITWLVGNHDVPYMEDYFRFKNSNNFSSFRKRKQTICSGYTKSKSLKITKVFIKNKSDFFENLELCVFEQDFLISHAGFHPIFLKPFITIQENIDIYKNTWDQIKKSNLIHEDIDLIYAVGKCRGGVSHIGGPLWLDWNDEFEPVDGLSQIVGHTMGGESREKNNNFCLDDGNKNVYYIQNKKLHLK